MSEYIPVNQIEADRLSANAPQTLKFQPPKKGSFIRMYYRYRYDTEEGEKTAEPLFELQISTGVIRKKDEEGGVTWKLNLSHNIKEDIDGLKRLDEGRKQCIHQHKGPLSLYNFDPAAANDLRGTFFYPRDKNTGEINGDPIVSLKFREYEADTACKIVVDQEGNTRPINFMKLENHEITCSVIFTLNNEYKGSGNPSPQCHVRSCMILGAPRPKGAVDHTKSSMVQDYLKQNPAILDNLAEQIEKMNMAGPVSSPSLLGNSEGAPTTGMSIDTQSNGQNNGQNGNTGEQTISIPQLPNTGDQNTDQSQQQAVQGQQTTIQDGQAGQQMPNGGVDLSAYLSQGATS